MTRNLTRTTLLLTCIRRHVQRGAPCGCWFARPTEHCIPVCWSLASAVIEFQDGVVSAEECMGFDRGFYSSELCALHYSLRSAEELKPELVLLQNL